MASIVPESQFPEAKHLFFYRAKQKPRRITQLKRQIVGYCGKGSATKERVMSALERGGLSETPTDSEEMFKMLQEVWVPFKEIQGSSYLSVAYRDYRLKRVGENKYGLAYRTVFPKWAFGGDENTVVYD